MVRLLGGILGLASIALGVVFPAPSAYGWSPGLSVSSSCAAPWRPAPRVDNVLIIVVDTLRADRLRAYDPNSPIASPAFERLAEEGQLFEFAYAHASWTKPSVATLLTGVLPPRHGATTHTRALDPSVPALAEHLSSNGYETGAFVANGYISERFGFARGFDEFRNAAQTGRSRGEELVEDLLRWVDAREHDKRFFAFLHTTDVHAPYLPRSETLATLDGAPYRGPIDFEGAPRLLQRIERGEFELSARDRRRLEALYDAGVYDHDEEVLGPLLEGLRERGILDTTLVVFTSDHGEELFDHGSVGHGGARVWQELIHVPLVIRWPGLSPSRISGPVGLVSIAATIADAVGLPPMSGLDAPSLVPVIEARRRATGPVLGVTGGLSFAILDQYKLIRSQSAADAWVDLRHDPFEHTSTPEVGLETLGRLGAALTQISAMTPPRPPTATMTIDPETLQRLRALGYVD